MIRDEEGTSLLTIADCARISRNYRPRSSSGADSGPVDSTGRCNIAGGAARWPCRSRALGGCPPNWVVPTLQHSDYGLRAAWIGAVDEDHADLEGAAVEGCLFQQGH